MEPCRQMGLAAVVAAVTGESVAFGNFLTPAAMAKSLGPPLLVVAVWWAWLVPAKPLPVADVMKPTIS